MRKYISFILVSILLCTVHAKADEGMWLISLLKQMNMDKLYEKGLELTPEDIYNVNNSSLKDAVVALDYGSCTGEFISKNGLILTNFHCAHDNVQKISSVDNDYLHNGFWAKSFEDEIPISGKTLSVLHKVEDITDLVNMEIEKETKAGKNNAFMMRRIFHKIEREMNAKSGYETSVSSMFGGNQYFLFYYTIYKDVRLVGAPPLSIGYFGGETDNWMWPQQRGDFAFYRVYTSKDGKPAEYSQENIPFNPKKHLKISLNGVKEGDYAMTLGYPFTIDRYLSSYGIEELIEILNPAQIAVREQKLAIMKKAMDKDKEVQIKYSSKFFNSANYYKYAIGENKYVKLYEVVKLKREQEAKFEKWYSQKKSRKAKYGTVLNDLNKNYTKKANYEKTEKYYQEAFVKGSDMIQMALSGKGWESILKKENPSKSSLDRKIELGKSKAESFYKDYDYHTDKQLFAAGIKLFVENVDKQYVADVLIHDLAKFGNDYDKFADYIYSNSIFSSKENFYKFLEEPTFAKIQNDPAYKIVTSTLDIIYNLRAQFKPYKAEIRKLDKLYIEGLLEMNKGKDLYPDANSTMRLSYGTVGGYSPRDAVSYDYYTTIEGYLEKESTENSEFLIDKAFKELVESDNYGPYANENGELVVNFLTNNDITGGNSGSPVMNGKGELIGVAFDGNWESMAGGVYFHPYFNKTVCVDIRYVLFVVDRYYDSKHIMQELDIIK